MPPSCKSCVLGRKVLMSGNETPEPLMTHGRRASGTAVAAAKILPVAIAAISSIYPCFTWAQSAGQWRDANHIFAKTCAHCHDTGVGPELRGRNLPAQYITLVVQNGLRAMPAFRPTDFSAAEVEALAKMISQSPAPAAPKAEGPATPAPPAPKGERSAK